MGDFEEKLETILNNPQAMSQIMALAQSLGGTSSSNEPPVESSPVTETAPLQLDPRMLSDIASLLSQYNSNDDQRVALLTALKPFVKTQRYAKLEQAIRITKLSRMARMALDLFRSEEG